MKAYSIACGFYDNESDPYYVNVTNDSIIQSTNYSVDVDVGSAKILLSRSGANVILNFILEDDEEEFDVSKALTTSNVSIHKNWFGIEGLFLKKQIEIPEYLLLGLHPLTELLHDSGGEFYDY